MNEEKRVIDVEGVKYNVDIFYEARQFPRASITGKGIYLRIPRYFLQSRRENEIQKLLVWVVEKIKKDDASRQLPQKYFDGCFLKTESKIYQINIKQDNNSRSTSKVNYSHISFNLSNKLSEEQKQKYISKRLQKLLAKNHLQELHTLIHRINSKYFNKQINKISFKYTLSRWGSCNTKTKEINISTRLLLAPIQVLEYVIVHELAHLIEPSHNEKFWNIVRGVDPHFKDKLKWLKVNRNSVKI